jgi:hypothetical protein
MSRTPGPRRGKEPACRLACVTPAKTGVKVVFGASRRWNPACAGMTEAAGDGLRQERSEGDERERADKI